MSRIFQRVTAGRPSHAAGWPVKDAVAPVAAAADCYASLTVASAPANDVRSYAARCDPQIVTLYAVDILT